MGIVFCDEEDLLDTPVLRRFDSADIFRHVLARKAVTTLFQPIVSLRDGTVLAYEALSRGPLGSPLHSPANLIAAARQCGMSMSLESMLIRKAMENAHKIPDGVKLFVNVDPAMLGNADFRDELDESMRMFSVGCGKVVFELTEREPVGDAAAFRSVMDEYGKRGFGIAMDDLGSGHSGLNILSVLRPHYIKLDMELVRGVDRDPVKRAMIRCLGAFAEETGIAAVAEGIETREELAAVADLGIPYGQGYLIQKPSESPNLRLNDISAAIFNGRSKSRFCSMRLLGRDRVFAGLPG